MTRLVIRLDFDEGRALGPGKVRLLELIASEGSISAAGRAMGMSYRRAWLLVDELNRSFRAVAVETHPGGGGGATLTSLGREIVARYRSAERASAAAVADHVSALEAVLAERSDLSGDEGS